jgi:hypothetical protein
MVKGVIIFFFLHLCKRVAPIIATSIKGGHRSVKATNQGKQKIHTSVSKKFIVTFHFLDVILIDPSYE